MDWLPKKLVRPTDMPYEIHIQPVLNGFVCRVGCQIVVYDDLKHMCKEIERYYKSPEKVEKEYRDNALNKQSVLEPAGQPVCAAQEDCPRPNPAYR